MNPDSIHVLFVEDNEDLRDDLSFQLRSTGIRVTAVADGIAMDKQIKDQKFDIALLDIGLPGENGLSIAIRLREASPNIGIIMLTALDELDTCLQSYQSGADVFLAKPVDWRRLAAQIQALYRRLPQVSHSTKQAGWKLLQSGHVLVTPCGSSINLTGMEASVILALAKKPGQTVKRDELIAIVSPGNVDAYDPRRLEVCLSRLRQKIHDALVNTNAAVIDTPIKTVRGVGYTFTQSISIETLF